MINDIFSLIIKWIRSPENAKKYIYYRSLFLLFLFLLAFMFRIIYS